jgi:hypothetical protein
MFKTAPKAAERFSNIIFKLVNDNYLNSSDKEAHEAQAKTDFDEAVRRCNTLSAKQKNSIAKLFEKEISREIYRATDFPGVEIKKSTSLPINRENKMKLDQIHEELIKEAHECFDSFSKDTSIEKRSDSGSRAASSKRRKSSGGTRKQKQKQKQNK